MYLMLKNDNFMKISFKVTLRNVLCTLKICFFRIEKANRKVRKQLQYCNILAAFLKCTQFK